MKTTTTFVAPVGAVTAQYDFCPATPEGENLFSVRAGIPLSSAFDQLSKLVSSSIASVEALAMMGEEDPDLITGALWQSVHLMNFAYALIQSMHGGHHEAGKLLQGQTSEGNVPASPTNTLGRA